MKYKERKTLMLFMKNYYQMLLNTDESYLRTATGSIVVTAGKDLFVYNNANSREYIIKLTKEFKPIEVKGVYDAQEANGVLNYIRVFGEDRYFRKMIPNVYSLLVSLQQLQGSTSFVMEDGTVVIVSFLGASMIRVENSLGGCIFQEYYGIRELTSLLAKELLFCNSENNVRTALYRLLKKDELRPEPELMDFSSVQSIKSSTVSTEYMPEEDCLFMEKDGLSAVFYQVESGDVYCQGNLFQEYNSDVIPYGVEQMLRDLVVYTDEEERYKAFATMYDLMKGDAMPEIRYVFKERFL